MEFTVVKFFAYNIRSTVIEVERSSTGETCTRLPVRMFLVSDLLNQYNEKHGTNKQFYHYLRNQQTQELLERWPSNFDHPNSDEQTTGVFWDITGVIKYVSFSINTQGGVKDKVKREQILRHFYFVTFNRYVCAIRVTRLLIICYNKRLLAMTAACIVTCGFQYCLAFGVSTTQEHLLKTLAPC